MQNEKRKISRAKALAWTLVTVAVSALLLFILMKSVLIQKEERIADQNVEKEDSMAAAAIESIPEPPKGKREGGTGGISLEVSLVDSRDDVPIASASLCFAERERRHVGRKFTNADGIVSLPQPGTYLVLAQAEAYASLMVQIDLEAGPQKLYLLPAGSLRLRVSDEKGDPVPGFRAAVLPPLASDEEWDHGVELETILGGLQQNRFGHLQGQGWENSILGLDEITWKQVWNWSDQWIQRQSHALGKELDLHFFSRPELADAIQETDPSGVLRWDHLPVSKSYRWAVLSAHKVLLEPPFEKPKYQAREGGLVENVGLPITISGPFEIKAGEETYLEGRVLWKTGVRGRLVNHQDLFRGEGYVRLYHLEEALFPGAPGLASLEEEQAMVVHEPGVFRFHGIKPGDKAISASWRDQERIYLVQRAFSVGEGEDADLGQLQPQGVSQEIRFRFEDLEGQPVEVGKVLPKGGSMQLMIRQADQGLAVSERIWDVLSVQPEQALQLYGMPAGEWRFTLDHGSNSTPFLDGYQAALAWPPEHWVRTPRVEPVEIPFQVVGTRPLRITLGFPEGDYGSAEVHLFHRQLARRFQIFLHSKDRSGNGKVAEGQIDIPLGSYEVMAFAVSSGAFPEVPNLTAFHEVQVGPEKEHHVRLDLQEGAILELEVCGKNGSPRSNWGGSLALKDWVLSSGQAVQVFSYRTDSQGKVTLQGLPPGMILLNPGDRSEIRLGGPGELRSHRMTTSK
ncbi:MAG: hypothetical protein DWQ01_18530 [Planctomycetota bacterium]|nr:MAG: hypothetical protein DWQ01_18530 [Planctomycetota bacterium]